MSGPKSSTYTLTAAQRRILAAQREAELKRISEEKRREEERKRKEEELRKKKALISDASSIDSSIKTSISRVERSKAENEEQWHINGDDGGWGNKFNELKETGKKSNSLIKTATTEKTINELAEIKANVSICLSTAKSIESEISSINQKNNLRFNKSVTSSVNAAFEKGFDFDTPLKTEVKLEANYGAIVQDNQYRLEILSAFELSKELSEQVEKAKVQMLSMMDEMQQDFQAVTIIPLEKECKLYIVRQEQYQDELTKLHPEYLSLCERSGEEPKHYTATEISIKALKNEVERLKEEIEKDEEQVYIANAIDEAMIEMGYSVLGHNEVTRKNGKHVKKDLYRYNDGTAVNVSTTSDGQITMELGAIDTEDRLPSATEASSLCEDMRSFCNSFSQIEEILLKKGVVLKNRISLLPPDESFAQIININKYTLIGDTKKVTAKMHTSPKNEKMETNQ